MASLFCPGFAATLRSHGSLNALAIELGISNSALYRANDVVSQRLFDLLFPKFKVLWDRNFCKMEERPRNTEQRTTKASKLSSEYSSNEREYGAFKIKTPHLDAFNGVEGGF